jgi:hypothetical protein
MLIHRQNSYEPRGKRRSGRREAQSCEPADKVKKFGVYVINFHLPASYSKTYKIICTELFISVLHGYLTT